MKSRITQLVSRLVGVIALYFAARFGLSDDQTSTLLQYGDQFAVWAVAIGAFALDIYIHRRATGAVTAPAGTAKPKQDSSPTLRSWAWPALVLVAMFAVTGCSAVNTATIDDNGIATTAQPASLASIDAEGNLRASYQGVPPTTLQQDSDGTWLTTPGQGGVLTYDPQTNRMYLWSPKDARLTNVKFTPAPAAGEPAFTADLVELNLSPVAAIYADQFKSAMEAIQGMTQAEATARVQELQATGQITSTVADAVKAVIPLVLAP